MKYFRVKSSHFQPDDSPARHFRGLLYVAWLWVLSTRWTNPTWRKRGEDKKMKQDFKRSELSYRILFFTYLFKTFVWPTSRWYWISHCHHGLSSIFIFHSTSSPTQSSQALQGYSFLRTLSDSILIFFRHCSIDSCLTLRLVILCYFLICFML